MKSIYVFGPIHLFGQDYLPVYKHLNNLCGKYFDKVIGTYPDFWDSKETPREFYDRTSCVITQCDLFVGEVSSPSMGVGMEFQMAQEHNIPCIALCKKDVKPSVMIIGIPCTRRVVYYTDLIDLAKQMDKILKDLSWLKTGE
jgi:hypothetical protein